MKSTDTLRDLSRYFSTHPLTRDAPYGAWARFVSWQVRSRLEKEVIVEWIGGQRLAVRLGMHGATGNIYVGLDEFCDMMLALHLLREGDLFLDVGSNIGSYTVLASGVRRAMTQAFEPDPDTVAALKRNIDINCLNDRVVVHEVALGDIDGTVLFTRGLDTVNRIASERDSAVRSVSIRRLDSVGGANRPLMIKMDVEGFEEGVVRGAVGLLAGSSLKVIQLETVTPYIETTLHQHGFERGYYDPFHRALTTSPNGLPSANAVFARDWEFVADRLLVAPAVDVLGKSI